MFVSKFIREQKRYSKDELREIFNLTDEEFLEFVKKLKAYGVLKMVKNTSKQKDLSDLIEEDIEIVDIDINDANHYYVFTFVGLLTVGNTVIKCFPKYILGNEKPFEEMKEILKVLTKYNHSKEQIIHFSNGYDEHKEFNMLAIILYLINDYNEYGIYKNSKDIIETNGDGEILWDNTINDTFAIIINNRPFYTELQTRNVMDNEMDYISRLHKFIITECSQKLKEGGLLDLFEINEINISDEELDDFGDRDYMLYELQKELNVQFFTRKQILLKTLCLYISHRKSFNDYFGLSMYGTNSFNLVWEQVCAQAFENKLSTLISELSLPVNLHEDFQDKEREKLLKVIDYPIWKPFESEDCPYEKPTLTPDIVSLYEIECGICFGIFDAKYYNIVLNKNELRNYPGVADVTKQYLYQLAFNNFIKKHSFADVKNVFLFPTENDCSCLIGEVKMGILEGLSNPPLTKISIVKLSARKMFKWYLNGQKLDISDELYFLVD